MLYRHCGLVVSAPAWDGTGCEFDSWQCRIYIPCSKSLRLFGSLWGSLGTYGLSQKLCSKKLYSKIAWSIKYYTMTSGQLNIIYNFYIFTHIIKYGSLGQHAAWSYSRFGHDLMKKINSKITDFFSKYYLNIKQILCQKMISMQIAATLTITLIMPDEMSLCHIQDWRHIKPRSH